jgi:hypothetical protein
MLALIAATVIDLGLGYGSSGQDNVPGALALSAAASHGGELWSAGVRGILLRGPEGKDAVGGGASLVDLAGFRAWAILAEAQAHSRGALQLGVRVGAGLGRLVRIQQGLLDETYAWKGPVAPSFAAALTGRVQLPISLLLGVEVGTLVLTHVSQGPNPVQNQPPAPPVVATTHVLVTLGWSH